VTAAPRPRRARNKIASTIILSILSNPGLLRDAVRHTVVNQIRVLT
jgi:hypothetical protein